MLAIRRRWHFVVFLLACAALVYFLMFIYSQFQSAVATLPRSLHQCLGFQPPKVDQIIRSVIVDNEKSAQMITKPIIFVGGVPRSGTTLMRVLLDAHPDIRCGEETRVITRVLSMRYNWETREIERKRLDAAGLNLTVLDDATRSFISQVILNHGPPAEYYCNKDPLNFKYLTTLTRLYPNGKYILMIRDGRAVAHSIVSRNVTIGGVDTKSYLSAVSFWNKAMTTMLEQCKSVGEKKCLEIYYEKLVLDIETWMRKILEFVGIEWHPNVLRHHELILSKEISLSKMEPSTNQVKEPVYKKAIDKWRQVIPKDMQRTMYRTAPLLQQPFPQSGAYKLILASNRDEFYDRPTDTVRFWDDNPNICAGRDRQPLRGDGTWLGISKIGRIASLTNVRIRNDDHIPNATGRGHLVVDCISSNDKTLEDYISGLSATADNYNGYNLLMGDFGGAEPKMACFTNQNGGETVNISPGIYGLCNAKLDSPWKKLVYGKERFTDIVSTPQISKGQLTEQLFDLMSDKTCCYPDPNLPDTQWNSTWMEGCSSIYVHIPEYGTRTQTVILIGKDNHVTYVEKTLVNPRGRHHRIKTESIEFNLSTKS